MKVFSAILISKAFALLCIYALLMSIFSIRMIYYSVAAAWVYIILMHLVFIYAIYYCISLKKNRAIVLIVVSLLISYMPYETQILRIVRVLKDPSNNLSPLSEHMPLMIGVFIDVIGYPMLMAVPVMLLHFVFPKSIGSE